MPDFSNLTLDSLEQPKDAKDVLPNLTEMELLRGLLSFIQTGQSLDKNFYSKMSAYSDSFYMPTLNGLAEASIMEVGTESVFAGK